MDLELDPSKGISLFTDGSCVRQLTEVQGVNGMPPEPRQYERRPQLSEHDSTSPEYHKHYMRHYRLEMDEDARLSTREQNRLAKIRRRREMAALILEQKDRPCVDCSIRLPPECMEFDHVRGEKRFAIGAWENARLGHIDRRQAVLDEIAKCDVRCPNCHRVRHFRDRSES